MAKDLNGYTATNPAIISPLARFSTSPYNRPVHSKAVKIAVAALASMGIALRVVAALTDPWLDEIWPILAVKSTLSL